MSDRRHTKRPWSGHRNPPRGAAGILWTCEKGREIKCEREGRAILRYYWEKGRTATTTVDTAKKLTLDEELASLQQQQRREKEVFPLFDTGCQGTAIMLYAPTRRQGHKKESEAVDSTASPSNKRPRTEASDAQRGASDPHMPPWNPVATVQAVVQDITSPGASSSSQVPGSRFVTRMIPLQATCLASAEELESVLRTLLQTHERTPDERAKDPSSPKVPTFRIHVKRRNCGHLTSQQVIDTAAGLVMKMTGWTVQLKDSDFAVWVEVCKSLMGVSLLTRHDLGLAKNFNLAELRDKHGEDDEQQAALDKPSSREEADKETPA